MSELESAVELVENARVRLNADIRGINDPRRFARNALLFCLIAVGPDASNIRRLQTRTLDEWHPTFKKRLWDENWATQLKQEEHTTYLLSVFLEYSGGKQLLSRHDFEREVIQQSNVSIYAEMFGVQYFDAFPHFNPQQLSDSISKSWLYREQKVDLTGVTAMVEHMMHGLPLGRCLPPRLVQELGGVELWALKIPLLQIYERNKELVKDDRRWFCVFIDTFNIETLRPWAQTSDINALFPELSVFLQQSLDADQLLLALRASANLDRIQLEAKKSFDAAGLILALRALENPDKSTSRINALSLSITDDLLCKFDSAIKKRSFDRSMTISRHIYPIALDVALSNTQCFSPYVQDMLYWSYRDVQKSHKSGNNLIRNYWLKRFTKGLSHQDALDEIGAMKTGHADDNSSLSINISYGR